MPDELPLYKLSPTNHPDKYAHVLSFFNFLKDEFGAKSFTRKQAIDILEKHTCSRFAIVHFNTLLVNNCIVRVSTAESETEVLDYES